MAEIYVETVVKRRSLAGGRTIQSLLLGTMALTAILGLGVSPVFLVITAVLGAAWYYVRQNTDVEFEYAHSGGELDIDKVIANSSRKRLVTVVLERVETVALVDSPELSRFQSLKTVDYSAKDPDQPPYGMVCTVGGTKQILLLQLDDKMLESLRKVMPGKVYKA